jgi:diguanylate cyclase (GGDEF)-like protein
MFNLHTVYATTLVSQATSALVLVLLAWADRRSRWLIPLAAACSLHIAAIYLMPLWRGAGLWLPHAISAAILIAMLYLIHLGLQTLVSPKVRRSTALLGIAAAAMIVLFGLAYYSSLWCTEVSTFAASVLLGWTVRMLWTARRRELSSSLRVTALLLFAILVLFLVRMPLELRVPAPPLLLTLRELTMLLVTLMAFSFLTLYAAETRRRLHDESRTDVLTGLLNRRAMEETAAEQVSLAARTERPCALLLVDLDEFKKLNDTWGHSVGDHALTETGRLLLRAKQEMENCYVARIGGEEFTLLLANCDVTAARALAERLCDRIAALRLPTGEQDVRLTASVGVSGLQPGETGWGEMLRRADIAMYQAKRGGRNRVVLSGEAYPSEELVLGEELVSAARVGRQRR